MRRRSRLIRLLVLLVLAALMVGGWFYYQHSQSQQLKHFPVRGVALNQDNGLIDFQQLQHQNVQFAYLKASSGATYTDDQFQSGYDRAQGSNVQIGVYHVFSFSTSPNAQLTNFARETANRHGDLPIAVQVTAYHDYDTQYMARPAVRRRFARFITLMANRYHRSMVVWCRSAVWRALAPKQKLGHLVISNRVSGYSKQIRFIQYSDNTDIKISGQQQSVDGIVFNGSQREWNVWVTQ